MTQATTARPGRAAAAGRPDATSAAAEVSPAATADGPEPIGGCEKATRRRGGVLEGAIREATLCVLAEVGFDRLTMDLVAERAQTGKRVLYRRWPTKIELVVNALEVALARRPPRLPDTGELRSDLVVLLSDWAALLRSRDGNLMARLSVEVGACAALRQAAEARLWSQRRAVVQDVIARAVARGQARPDALSNETVTVGFSLLFLRSIAEGRRVTRRDAEAIVDHVWLPALRP